MLVARIVLAVLLLLVAVALIRSTTRFKEWNIIRKVAKRYDYSELIVQVPPASYTYSGCHITKENGVYAVSIELSTSTVPPFIQMIREELLVATRPSSLGAGATMDAQDEEINVWRRDCNTTYAATLAARLLNKHFMRTVTV
jgi:hypothetical protein